MLALSCDVQALSTDGLDTYATNDVTNKTNNKASNFHHQSMSNSRCVDNIALANLATV